MSPTKSSWVGKEVAFADAQKKKTFPVRIAGTIANAVPIYFSTAHHDSIVGLSTDERKKAIQRIVMGIIDALT